MVFLQGAQLSDDLLMCLGQATDCLPQIIGLIRMSRLQLLNDRLVMHDLALCGHHMRTALCQLSLILNGLLPKLRCCLTQAAINRLLEQFADPSLRLQDGLCRLSHREYRGGYLLDIQAGRFQIGERFAIGLDVCGAGRGSRGATPFHIAELIKTLDCQ